MWAFPAGDPTFVGWFTVVVYLLAAFLCHQARKSAQRCVPAGADTFEPSFWGSLALICLSLAVNKQLDLQSVLTAVGRDVAKENGWYEHRRVVQKGLVFSAGVIGITSIALLLPRLLTASRWTWLGLIGLAMLTTFVLIRAASFHHVNALITQSIGGPALNHVLEIGALLVLGIAAGGRRFARSRHATCDA